MLKIQSHIFRNSKIKVSLHPINLFRTIFLNKNTKKIRLKEFTKNDLDPET